MNPVNKMQFIVPPLISTGVYLLSKLFSSPRPYKPKLACYITGQFDIPMNGMCAQPKTYYNLIYLSPRSKPVPVAGAEIVTIGGQDYTQYYPNTNSYQNSEPNSNVFMWTDSGGPVNFCPQTLATPAVPATPLTTAIPEASNGAICLNLPLTRTGVPSAIEPMFTILPGQTNYTLNPESKPSIGLAPGQANILYICCNTDATIYIELGGAQGGSVNIYSNGLDFNGLPTKLTGYIGGLGGIVTGLLEVKKNDVLKVHLGSGGTYVQDALGADSQGQGGLGTIFGGANGGGASYIEQFQAQATINATLQDAFSNIEGTKHGNLIAVAGGGGGASRNAAGGNAGLCEWSNVISGADADRPLAYGLAVQTRVSGSIGGQSFVLGAAPFIEGYAAPSGYSGGGGLSRTGGSSCVTDQVPAFASNGKALQPFVGLANSGGGSVITNSGSGGGGGGGGLFGGGAGGWNQLCKPRNVHGAGGGGSSWSTLRPAADKDFVSMNLFRNLNWPTGIQAPSGQASVDGFLVLGIAFH